MLYIFFNQLDKFIYDYIIFNKTNITTNRGTSPISVNYSYIYII